ncbi:MAG: 50S ribosomal protein L5 [Candidatus Parcubacteria bacterium]|nr:50S ribosomal protein L5 [Candidatus Parcubacteria bacterium]
MMTPKEKFKKKIIPELKKQFGLKNDLEVPRIEKVVLNVGLGKSLKDANFLDNVESTLMRITGQKPIKTKAKKSISNFKIRKGMVIGLKVTLRGQRMYDFLEKLVNVVLPRVRDFRGLTAKAIDQGGNLNIGIKEHLAFPEIKADEIEKLHGLEIAVVTTAKSREEGRALLVAFGFPFKE